MRVFPSPEMATAVPNQSFACLSDARILASSNKGVIVLFLKSLKRMGPAVGEFPDANLIPRISDMECGATSSTVSPIKFKLGVAPTDI